MYFHGGNGLTIPNEFFPNFHFYRFLKSIQFVRLINFPTRSTDHLLRVAKLPTNAASASRIRKRPRGGEIQPIAID